MSSSQEFSVEIGTFQTLTNSDFIPSPSSRLGPSAGHPQLKTREGDMKPPDRLRCFHQGLEGQKADAAALHPGRIFLGPHNPESKLQGQQSRPEGEEANRAKADVYILDDIFSSRKFVGLISTSRPWFYGLFSPGLGGGGIVARPHIPGAGRSIDASSFPVAVFWGQPQTVTPGFARWRPAIEAAHLSCVDDKDNLLMWSRVPYLALVTVTSCSSPRLRLRRASVVVSCGCRNQGPRWLRRRLLLLRSK